MRNVLVIVSAICVLGTGAVGGEDRGKGFTLVPWDIYQEALRWQVMAPGVEVPQRELLLILSRDLTQEEWEELAAAGYEIQAAVGEMVRVSAPVTLYIHPEHGLDTLNYVRLALPSAEQGMNPTAGSNPSPSSATSETTPVSDEIEARSGRILIVPHDYPTIQAAINAAAAGDTVFVMAGMYKESVFIKTPLRLVGEDRAAVCLRPREGDRSAVMISLEFGEVLIRDLTIAFGETGIHLSLGERASAAVENVLALGLGTGVSAHGLGSLRIADCLFYETGLGLSSHVAELQLVRCEIVGAGPQPLGAALGGVGTAKVEDCRISDVYAGIFHRDSVLGQRNRISAEDPVYPASSLPPGFLDLDWAHAIAQVHLLVARAIAALELGDPAEAVEALEMGLPILEVFPLPDLEANVHNMLGGLLAGSGSYESAIAHYEAERSIYLMHGLTLRLAQNDVNLGGVYAAVGDYEKALSRLRSARAVFAAWELEVDVARAETNLGVVYSRLQLYEEALFSHSWARFVFSAHGELRHIALVEENLCSVYTELGQYEDAIASCQRARRLYAAFGDTYSLADVDLALGIVYQRLGLNREAIAAFDQYLAFLDGFRPLPEARYSLPIQRAVTLMNKGLACESLTLWDEAVAVYTQALDVIESARASLMTEGLKLAWGEQTRFAYDKLIDLLYRMGEGAQAFPYAERSRARTFLDILYGGGVQPDQLISAEAGVSAGVVRPEAIDAAVDQALAYLERGEAVFSYFVTERGVYLWTIAWDEDEGAHVVSEPVFREYPRGDLLRDVVETRKLLEAPSPTPAQKLRLEELLEGFYDALVLPGLARLPDEVDTLILVPSGPLWYVPFSALLMTDQPGIEVGRYDTRPPYLVERYTVAYLPSVASLPSLLERTEVGEGVYLGLADPELTEAQLERLGMTEAQYQHTVLQDAAIAFAQCQGGEGELVYVGTEATEGRAHREAPGHRVVVYAAHGQFNPHVPLQSGLYLAPSEGPRAEGDRRIADGAYRAWEILLTDHRGTELVVLAACESLLPALRNLQGQLGVLSGKSPDEIELTPEQLERITTGDEVVGMARAFLSSGAQRVLGTLWQANPGAIAQLLASACRHQQTGLTWAQALRQAQIELIAHPTYDHPWFWAPFQLIGRWR